MYRVGLLVALILAGAPAAACSIEEVAGQIQFGAISRAGELAKQQLVLLKKFREIGVRGREPNTPLNEQLSQADLAEFTQTQTRYQSIELLQLLESNYSRDNVVIRDFFQVAQAEYLGATPKEGDKDYLASAFLAVMFVAPDDKSIQDNLITVPEAKGCTLETAIHEIEKESLDRLQRLPLTESNRELEAMRARTGGAKINRENLGAGDRAIFDRIQRTSFVPAWREKTFITNLESLKLLARVATMKYELGKKDAVDSGGDIQAVGTSIAALNLDARTKMGFGMLEKIADKFPSEWFKEKERLAPAMEAIKKESAAHTTKKKAPAVKLQ